MQETRSPPRDQGRTVTRWRSEPADRDSPTAPPPDAPGGPVWLPDDGLITEEADRQVLVVGETVAGLALTLLLDRAGYDPVLVRGSETAPVSRLGYLWPPTLRLLDALGVDVSAPDCGVGVDRVDVRADGTLRSYVADTAAGRPALVRTTRLRRALEAELHTGQGRDRTVDSLSRHEGGLVVAFDDGVREWFDVAVDTSRVDGLPRSDGEQATPAVDGRDGETTALRQYEVPVVTDTDRDATTAPGHIHEGWQPGVLAESLPRPGDPGRLLRVTTACDAPATPTETVREALPDGATWVPALSGCEPVSVRQVSSLSADPARSWWGRGRVAFCGGATCPVSPASGVQLSAGIADALALVSALTRGPRAAADAVGAYAARRARRVGTLARTAATARADHAYPVPDRTQPALATLGLLRTVSLAPFLGGSLASLQREGFE
jgi:2-polyprenyl-6-methoxyphenol hydroxylase-like FAD-dependent oxidoreductase